MFLEVQHLDKQFKGEPIIRDLSLTLPAHQTLSVLGRSGCGKTTLLKMIAGIVTPDSGHVILDGERINDVIPEKRNIVYLYQEDLLFPHLTVFENIAFGLRIRKVATSEIEERVHRMINALELNGQADKYPHQLSGGQRQRVSFGRAIIINPALLLLDEPFGSLDVGTRARMQGLFQQLAGQFKITSIFVTHDLKEAILMGDQIGLMQKGQLQVYANREAFLQDPATGVHEEIDFWQSLQASSHPHKSINSKHE